MRSAGSGSSGGQKPGNDYQFDFGLGLSSSKPLTSLKDNKPPQQVPAVQSCLPTKTSTSWTPSYQTPPTGRGSQSQFAAGWSSGARTSSLVGTNVASKEWSSRMDTSSTKASRGSGCTPPGGGRDAFEDLLNQAMQEGPPNQQASSVAPASDSMAGMKLSLHKSSPLRQNVPVSSARSSASSPAFPPPIATGFNKQAPLSNSGHHFDDDIFRFPTSTRSSVPSPDIPPVELGLKQDTVSASSTNGKHIEDFFSLRAFPTGNSSSSLSATDPFDLVSSSDRPPVAVAPSLDQSDSDPFGFGISSGVTAATSDPFPESTIDLFGDLRIREAIPKVTCSGVGPSATFLGGLDSLLPNAQRNDFGEPSRSRTRKHATSKSCAEQSRPVMSFDGWEQLGGGESQGGPALTTELEGLGSPPAGVTGLTANEKGHEYYRQGQFPDAVKWLSWAVDIWQRGGNKDQLKEALTCRVSCYKEVGEYRKAVADCSKVLEMDKQDTSVLLQRAFLYESMEKYRPSAEDFREVLRRDPNHKVAASTLTRLTKMMARPSFNF